MSGQRLTEELKEDLMAEIEANCGRMARPALAEVFEDCRYHGKNYTGTVVDVDDHVVVVLDCECSRGQERSGTMIESVIGDLFKKGIVVYYYHSIIRKRHHICLALRKIGVTYALDVTTT